MKAALAITALLLSTVIPPAALAQDSATQTGAVGETQKPAGSREPSNSFEALPLVFGVGQEVKVRDEAGRTTRGKVVSISDNQLVVVRARVEQAFAKEAVRSIDIVDSPWNGALIGAVGSAALLGAWVKNCESGECVQGRMFPAVIGNLAGILVGGLIDERITKRVYEHQPPTSRVTISPMLGRERIGLVARMRF
jgi:hypothetical protein